ncbi:sulfotransferase family protein [Henriciella aquimarina]|uniref:sulfotransferase family protein n=1 Tax=Henriciella aquimarina TaxID=545261 RepID=UPI000A036A8F|nr:sulfotransferase family protein [Henriciella aquimarina]
MALKVIGAGFGRTGTLSLKAALEQLGYVKCHHMLEIFPDDRLLDAWHDIAKGGTPDWDAVFDGYEATVDFPASAYWRELSAHFPEAKIILSVREFESWYASANETIYPASAGIPGWMTVIPKIRKIKEMTTLTTWTRVFDDRFKDKAHVRQVFEQHEADVKAAFPPERLLVFHPKEGWGPLCAFLDKPVPDTPFPNVNDREDFRKRVAMLARLRWLPWIAGGLAIAGALGAFLAFQ